MAAERFPKASSMNIIPPSTHFFLVEIDL